MLKFLKTFTSKKWLLAIGLVLLIGAGFLLSRLLNTSSQKTQYQTATATNGTVVAAVTGSGQVATTNSMDVTTEASGVVSKVLIAEGQTVKAGAAIAKIDLDLIGKQKAQQALASYQSAKNQLAQSQADLWSLQNKEFVANQTFMNGAVASNLVSADPSFIEQKANWLAAEANYINQQHVISQAQLAVSQAWLSYQQSSDTVYAPISGTVTGLTLQVGTVIQSSESSNKIASIITTAAPTIKVNLTEMDVPKMKVGNKATITLDALSDKTFVGKVVSIDTVGSVSSNVTSYPIIIQLDDTGSGILPNMAATANIIIDSKVDVLTVPNAAIQKNNGQTTVRVLQNEQVQNVAVTVGLVGDSLTEVTSGLKEGDTVVTSVVQTTSSKTTTSTSPFSALGGRGFSGR